MKWFEGAKEVEADRWNQFPVFTTRSDETCSYPETRNYIKYTYQTFTSRPSDSMDKIANILGRRSGYSFEDFLKNESLVKHLVYWSEEIEISKTFRKYHIIRPVVIQGFQCNKNFCSVHDCYNEEETPGHFICYHNTSCARMKPCFNTFDQALLICNGSIQTLQGTELINFVKRTKFASPRYQYYKEYVVTYVGYIYTGIGRLNSTHFIDEQQRISLNDDHAAFDNFVNYPVIVQSNRFGKLINVNAPQQKLKSAPGLLASNSTSSISAFFLCQIRLS